MIVGFRGINTFKKKVAGFVRLSVSFCVGPTQRHFRGRCVIFSSLEQILAWYCRCSSS